MTKKQSNSVLNKTHFKGCHALLFRFKDECGKEMSLVAVSVRESTASFNPKDLTPGCMSVTTQVGFAFNSYILYTGTNALTPSLGELQGVLPMVLHTCSKTVQRSVTNQFWNTVNYQFVKL